jgi:hypothetical protein
MTLYEAIDLFKDHQKDNAKEKTRESCGHLLRSLEALLGDAALDEVSSQALCQFLLLLTEGAGQINGTSSLRAGQGLVQLRHRKST